MENVKNKVTIQDIVKESDTDTIKEKSRELIEQNIIEDSGKSEPGKKDYIVVGILILLVMICLRFGAI